MMFALGGIDGESIFKLVDQPLDVAHHHGQFVLCPIATSLLF